MADLLPQNFPSTGEAGVTTYTFTEASSGLGVINYKGYSAKTSGATTYILGTQNIYSATTSTTAGAGSTTTIDFDTEPFNFPRTVKGMAYLSAAVGVKGNGYCSGAVIIQKWDGSTATNISSQVSSQNLGGSGTTIGMILVPLSLTQTTIQKGEQLRCEVEIEGTDVSEICHDPQGRAGTLVSGTAVSTQFNLWIPFRVDA